MARFGRKSKLELATVHPKLKFLFEGVVSFYDCSIICGHRSFYSQEKAFTEGRSKLSWPNSKHNREPSQAVDVIPWPSQFTDEKEFYVLATHVFKVASEMNIKVIWGGHWHGFFDGPHWELHPDEV